MVDENQPYHSFSQWLFKKYGEQIYRVPINPGFSCPKPNGDPCYFCPHHGHSAIQIQNLDDIKSQAIQAISFARRRYHAQSFLLYLQAYTPTHTSVHKLQSVITELLPLDKFRAVHIATRPDCLPSPILDYLEELNQTIPVCIELGIQTVHNQTLSKINRGHTWEDSLQAMNQLWQRRIHVAPHLILGLPEETLEDWNQTADTMGSLPIYALKIHNLHIYKNTKFAEWYQQGIIHPFSEYEYLEVLIHFLRRIPYHIPIMRLVTDSQNEDLLTPQWHLKKGQFLALLASHMKKRGYRQGDLCSSPTECAQNRLFVLDTSKMIQTQDGSYTLWHEEFHEHYHTAKGAQWEAYHKYVKHVPFQQLLSSSLKEIRILDICFGLGYNTLVTIEKWQSLQKELNIQDVILRIDAIELDRIRTSQAFYIHSNPIWQQIIQELVLHGRWQDSSCHIQIYWGDARYITQQFKNGGYLYHVIYHDPFSTQRCSELWTVEFFSVLRQILDPWKGRLLTYSTAGPVRAGMLIAELYPGEISSEDPEERGTIAVPHPALLAVPLSQETYQLLQFSIKGIPFRDPSLLSTNSEILARREKEVRLFREQNKT